jgi:hypothetical protein
MATMARIVSDDPPPMLRLQPKLPKALDKLVLRGLERERKRRWRTLEEFQRALLPFLPVEPSIGGIGLRFGAYLCETVLLSVSGQVVLSMPLFDSQLYLTLAAAFVSLVIYLIYYGVLEGLWGCSLGKRLVRLRVAPLTSTEPPGLARSLLRAGILYCLLSLPSETLGVLSVACFEWMIRVSHLSAATLSALLPGATFTLGIIGCAAALCTMRKRNGYRGLHEFLSGTRTYLKPKPPIVHRRTMHPQEFELPLSQMAGLPEQVGPYRIRGALRWTPTSQTLLGADPHLGRAVWIWIRPVSQQPLDEAQRAISRATRIRWLACGRWDDWQWDAFLAPVGSPLAELVSDTQPLTWADFRPILEGLAEELAASCAEGSLPIPLTVHQVWVNPKGGVQLLSAPLLGGGETREEQESVLAVDSVLPADDDQRALAFLAEIAILALEDRPRRAGAAPATIKNPLPLHAASMLGRLFPKPDIRPLAFRTKPPFRRVAELQAELRETQSEAVAVSRWLRAKQLAGRGILAAVGLMFMFILVGLAAWASPVHVMIVGLGLMFFFLPVYLLLGGAGFYRVGIAIVRADGRRASRLRRLYRAVLAWAVLVAIAAMTYWIMIHSEESFWLRYGALAAGICWLVGYIVLMLRNPSRAPHDYLAGTYLVPK